MAKGCLMPLIWTGFKQMASRAIYYDGNTAYSHDVMIEIMPTRIIISGSGVARTQWDYKDLAAVERPHRQRDLRLLNKKIHGARLIISPGIAADKVVELAPHLDGSFSMSKFFVTAGWVTASVIALVSIIYGILNLAPKTFASMLPSQFREQVGEQMEKKVVKNSRQCKNPAGERALLKLAGKVASGTNNPPDFSVRVYDMAMMNAFAVPDGRIVITRGLLKAAESPGEVAGVFAHELGHVASLHPESALVRIMGLQLFTSLITGTGNTETLLEFVGLATVLSYSRDAEREADKFAQQVLTNAKIDTVGLVEFFKRVKKQEDKLLGKLGKLGKGLSMLSTHPGTQERIAKLKPLPPGVAIDVLSQQEWQALKNICNPDDASDGDSEDGGIIEG